MMIVYANCEKPIKIEFTENTVENISWMSHVLSRESKTYGASSSVWMVPGTVNEK